MCNMKALHLLPFLVKKLWPRLKFFKSKSNFKVKVSLFCVLSHFYVPRCDYIPHSKMRAIA